MDAMAAGDLQMVRKVSARACQPGSAAQFALATSCARRDFRDSVGNKNAGDRRFNRTVSTVIQCATSDLYFGAGVGKIIKKRGFVGALLVAPVHGEILERSVDDGLRNFKRA